MSTLTKILIVLLTISSIFLCGIVVTYTANADNFKQKYDNQTNKLRAAVEKRENAIKQLNENITRSQQLEDKLNNEIASLEMAFAELEGALTDAEREKADLLQRSNNWEAITKSFAKTTDEQKKLFEETFRELRKIKSEQIKEQKELNEVTASLEQKMAIVTMLDEKTRRLLEEKVELQKRLDQLLQPFGKTAAPAVPVTPKKAAARTAVSAAGDIDLKGLVTAVDLKNSMAEISIGTANGVKKDMRFHITRGDEFICDILITDVDAEKAIGNLELILQQPKIGDNVSTNL